VKVFGHERRPNVPEEDFPSDDPLGGEIWILYAWGGEKLGSPHEKARLAFRLFKAVGANPRDEHERMHAAPKAGELWAFETGRLP